jgi:hypothetical protein
MKRIVACKILVLLSILASTCLLAYQVPISQAQTKVVNHPLTFHGYSVVLRDNNNSFIVYNGADGAGPSANGAQVTLQSQISGMRDGCSYWSAVAIWVIPLQNDVHVKGTVNIHAYISSKFSLSGFFSGGNYGFGVVDIDENNAEVKEFVSEGPVAIGRNPFTQEPAQYSLDVNVDYVFAKGHSIGFAVGFGATERGFDGTIYFDSQSRNSGAILPVEETVTSQTFVVQAGGASHNIVVASSSAVSGFQFDGVVKSVQFRAQGIPYTSGSCDVWVPKTLLQAPLKVTMGNQQLTASASENSTYTHLSFSHARTADSIVIMAGTATPTPSAVVIEEYPSTIILSSIAGILSVTMLLGLRKPRKH